MLVDVFLVFTWLSVKRLLTNFLMELETDLTSGGDIDNLQNFFFSTKSSSNAFEYC